jgi:hypothetical protein
MKRQIEDSNINVTTVDAVVQSTQPVANLLSEHQQDVSSAPIGAAATAAVLSVDSVEQNNESIDSSIRKLTENERLTTIGKTTAPVTVRVMDLGTVVQPGAVSVVGIEQENSESNSNQQQYQGGFLEHQVGDQHQLDVIDRQSQRSSTNSTVFSQQQDLNQFSSERQHQQDDDRNGFLIQAELVVPPVEAVSVVIDEENLHSQSINTDRHLGSSLQSSGIMEGSIPPQEESKNKLKRGIFGGLVAIAIFMVIVLVIVIPSAINTNTRNNESTVPAPESTFEDSEPSFDYPCFRSSRDLMFAQLNDFVISRFTKTKDLYIICPGTYIQVGVFVNPATNDYRITAGDYPLMPLMNDTTIQCGLDGSRENSCVLDGGFVHVLMQTKLPGIDPHQLGAFEVCAAGLSVHNVTIRGFTFTGITRTAGSLAGFSFLLSQSGNVTVEDCRWTEMTVVSNVLAVGQNDYQASETGGFEEVPTHSSMLTIRNCQFDNIVYDHPIIYTEDQIVVVDNCTFSDLAVSALPDLECDGWDIGGCANIMTCMGDAACFLGDSCINDVETLGPGILVYDNLYNTLEFAPNFPVYMDTGVLSVGAGTITDRSTFKEALSNYNNFLDRSRSTLDCEVVVLGKFWSTLEDNDPQPLECFDGLAFDANECMNS